MKTLGGGYTCSKCGQYHRTSVMCRCHLTNHERPKLIEATTSPVTDVITIEKVADCKLVYERSEPDGHDCWGNTDWYTRKLIMVNGKEEQVFDDWWVKHDGTKVIGFSTVRGWLEVDPEKPVETVIPTAEELMLQNNGDDFTHFEEIAELMRSFAQLHVDAAIKAVLKIKDASGHEPYGSYKYNIERCYPKANIK